MINRPSGARSRASARGRGTDRIKDHQRHPAGMKEQNTGCNAIMLCGHGPSAVAPPGTRHLPIQAAHADKRTIQRQSPICPSEECTPQELLQSAGNISRVAHGERQIGLLQSKRQPGSKSQLSFAAGSNKFSFIIHGTPARAPEPDISAWNSILCGGEGEEEHRNPPSTAPAGACDRRDPRAYS